MDEKLTAREVAERLGVSLSLVYLLIAQRQIAHVRIGGEHKRGKIVVMESDLQLFIQQRKREAV